MTLCKSEVELLMTRLFSEPPPPAVSSLSVEEHVQWVTAYLRPRLESLCAPGIVTFECNAAQDGLVFGFKVHLPGDPGRNSLKMQYPSAMLPLRAECMHAVGIQMACTVLECIAVYQYFTLPLLGHTPTLSLDRGLSKLEIKD